MHFISIKVLTNAEVPGCACLCVYGCVHECAWLLTPVISLASPLVLFCKRPPTGTWNQDLSYHVGSFRGLEMLRNVMSHSVQPCMVKQQLNHTCKSVAEYKDVLKIGSLGNVDGRCRRKMGDEGAKKPQCKTSGYLYHKYIVFKLILSIWLH